MTVFPGTVNGPVYGGGIGLVCACDIGVAVDSAVFAFSEVKLGLVPAVISPFVVNKLGESVCRDVFLTGRRFSAAEAKEFGMVHSVSPREDLDNEVQKYVGYLCANGPEAIAACKQLLQFLHCTDPLDAENYTAELIAKLRVNPEGQEGIRAFFDKRRPSWIKNR